MTFHEASNRLDELADGVYRALGFKKTMDGHGHTQTECYVYVHNVGGHTMPTWVAALDLLAQKMGKSPVEDTPEVEDE